MLLETTSFPLAHISTAPTYQDSGWLFWATCVLIALLFIWGKLAAYFNGQTGRIVALPERRGCAPQPIRIPVELWSGREVTAAIDGCLVCSLGLRAGDKVWITENAGGYVVIRAKGQSLKRLLREAVVDSSRECLLKREV